MTPETLTATIRLGATSSMVAAVLAVVLSAIGDVTQWSLVALVGSVVFVASWIQTGRLERGEEPLLVLSKVHVSR